MYHVEKIHGPQEHFCKHCPFSVFMIEGFKVHMETAHPEKAGRYIYIRWLDIKEKKILISYFKTSFMHDFHLMVYLVRTDSKYKHGGSNYNL